MIQNIFSSLSIVWNVSVCIYVLSSVVLIIRHFTEQLRLVQYKLKYMK